MSDYEIDDDDLQDLYEDTQDDDITPEEMFSMVLLDKIKGTKVTIELKDKEGDVIELADIMEGLIGYIKDKLEDEEGSDFTQQIFPMMGQALVSGLGRMIGIRSTAFYLSNEGIRTSMVQMMSAGFLLLKYVQEHELMIHTYEEHVSIEEIESIERKSKASNIAIMGSLMGASPREILQKMVDEGQISEEDLAELISAGQKNEDDEE